MNKALKALRIISSAILFAFVCQSARKRDPGSASKKDPRERLVPVGP
jgi:hypothetical protein